MLDIAMRGRYPRTMLAVVTVDVPSARCGRRVRPVYFACAFAFAYVKFSAGLRLVRHIALALAALFVCAVVANDHRSSDKRSAAYPCAYEVACAISSMAVERPEVSLESVPRPVDEPPAVELDLDDEDPKCDAAERSAVGVGCVLSPRELGRPPRGELATHASRFATATSLPRGPPAA